MKRNEQGASLRKATSWRKRCSCNAQLMTKHYSLFVPQQFCQRIQHGGDLANIALTRQCLEVIYYTLKNNWVFEDFPNFVLAS
jgi:hypothetical protein